MFSFVENALISLFVAHDSVPLNSVLRSYLICNAMEYIKRFPCCRAPFQYDKLASVLAMDY